MLDNAQLLSVLSLPISHFWVLPSSHLTTPSPLEESKINIVPPPESVKFILPPLMKAEPLVSLILAPPLTCSLFEPSSVVVPISTLPPFFTINPFPESSSNDISLLSKAFNVKAELFVPKLPMSKVFLSKNILLALFELSPIFKSPLKISKSLSGLDVFIPIFPLDVRRIFSELPTSKI